MILYSHVPKSENDSVNIMKPTMSVTSTILTMTNWKDIFANVWILRIFLITLSSLPKAIIWNFRSFRKWLAKYLVTLSRQQRSKDPSVQVEILLLNDEPTSNLHNWIMFFFYDLFIRLDTATWFVTMFIHVCVNNTLMKFAFTHVNIFDSTFLVNMIWKTYLYVK